MANKPKVSTAMVRRKVREVCNMAAGHGKTEAMLLDFVNELTGGGVDVQMLRAGIEWNLSQAFIRYVDGRETESGETEWFITQAGKAAENIK